MKRNVAVCLALAICVTVQSGCGAAAAKIFQGLAKGGGKAAAKGAGAIPKGIPKAIPRTVPRIPVGTHLLPHAAHGLKAAPRTVSSAAAKCSGLKNRLASLQSHIPYDDFVMHAAELNQVEEDIQTLEKESRNPNLSSYRRFQINEQTRTAHNRLQSIESNLDRYK